MNAGLRNRGRQAVAGAPVAGWLSPFAPLFHRLLDRIDRGLEVGAIEASLPDGRTRLLGGRGDGPVAIVDVRHWRALVRLATGGSAGWYEAWAAGEWASPDPVPLFELFVRNRISLGQAGRASAASKWGRVLVHWARRNSPRRARKNVAYHYDLGNDFYSAWLDAGMTYSSALFTAPGLSLEAAQDAKLSAMLVRAGVEPGDRLLEIGCGWGSFAEHAAEAGVQVHGITLSQEQLEHARARVPSATFNLCDYRDVTGRYDAVVSIEMVEAVGRAFWRDYLATIARVLKPGGRAALQMIVIDPAIYDAYRTNVDFIQAYVFPGGMLINEPEFIALAAREGLVAYDRLAFGAAYAATLKVWRERFDLAIREQRLPHEFDRDFIALWRYYLMYCEGGFRGGGIDVVQLTLVKEGGA
jgi:cyclopropane-fatty-acyl-phospholipid synthase